MIGERESIDRKIKTGDKEIEALVLERDSTLMDAGAVRFVEVVVNGPKSWSLAAELHSEIAAAYESAQDRAAAEIVAWLAQNVTTRVGPRGVRSRSQSRCWRPRWCGITRPGPAIRTGTCTFR